VTVFIKTYIYRHSDRNDIICFGQFKNISVYDRKMTEKIPAWKKLRQRSRFSKSSNISKLPFSNENENIAISD